MSAQAWLVLAHKICNIWIHVKFLDQHPDWAHLSREGSVVEGSQTKLHECGQSHFLRCLWETAVHVGRAWLPRIPSSGYFYYYQSTCLYTYCTSTYIDYLLWILFVKLGLANAWMSLAKLLYMYNITLRAWPLCSLNLYDQLGSETLRPEPSQHPLSLNWQRSAGEHGHAGRKGTANFKCNHSAYKQQNVTNVN